MNSFSNSQRIIIKIGSALLVDPETQELNREWFNSLISDIAQLYQQGKQVIVVCSGAIAIGKIQLGLNQAHLTLNKKQAASAVGQIELSHLFSTLCRNHALTAAQVLLTLADTENRRHYINLSNTLESLLSMSIVPIINENDSVGTTEIRYGDNDRLAARVAQMVHADTLILLSDIDGLYTDNPHTNPNANFIDTVDHLNEEHYGFAKSSYSQYGTGGMRTKLDAARIAVNSGTAMLIISGKANNPLSHYQLTQRGTWFTATQSPLKAKKKWLSEHLQQQGSVIIDAGAARALSKNASLLPIGVTAVQGNFNKGDVIGVIDPHGQQLTCGLTNYSSKDIKKLCQKHSSEIHACLGYHGYDEIIHRDNLGLLTAPNGDEHE